MANRTAIWEAECGQLLTLASARSAARQLNDGNWRARFEPTSASWQVNADTVARLRRRACSPRGSRIGNICETQKVDRSTGAA